jgi:hypothetical protein
MREYFRLAPSRIEGAVCHLDLVWFVLFCTMDKVMRNTISFRKNCSKVSIVIFLASVFNPISMAFASHHYTEKQLDGLEARVGKTFWVVSVNNRTPAFLSGATPNAPSFHAQPNEAFQITELIGRKLKNPYYKVKFASGKEGYILPEAFHEEFHLTIVSLDPQAEEKKKAAQTAEEDKKRVDWIRAQPWSQAVKESAIQGRPVLGMNTREVKRILGSPSRVSKIQAPQRFGEEHWFYADGSVLIFQNGLLTRIEPKEGKEQKTHQ